MNLLLRLTFPRAKLWRQIFMTRRNPGRRIGRKIGRKFGRNFLGIFVLHWLRRTTHQNFSPNSSQFITPCLGTAPVIEISKFHLRELLGLGVLNEPSLPENLHPREGNLVKHQWRRGSTSVVRWNVRPVIFGVECPYPEDVFSTN